MKSAQNLRELPLAGEYRAANAHMDQVFGWERPLFFGKTREPGLRFDRPGWFENVKAEVTAAHKVAAIFDASSFGKIDVTGPDAEAFLLKICAGYLGRPPGSVIYSAVLNDRGTFESDLTAQRIARDRYRLFVGTNAVKRDLTWFSRAAKGFDATLSDVTGDWAVLGLMGPRAAQVADALGAGDLCDIEYFRHCNARLAGCEVRAARLSYVGEPGWEITCLAEDAATIFAAMVQVAARPAGLLAQTSMRIEKGFCAMGHELDSDIGPIEAGLAFATRKSGDFTGYEAMSERRVGGATAQIVSLRLDDALAVPLGHEPIYRDGQIIGQCSSCAYGHRTGAPVALGRMNIPIPHGASVQVDIARTLFDATVAHGPLFDPDGSRMKA